MYTFGIHPVCPTDKLLKFIYGSPIEILSAISLKISSNIFSRDSSTNTCRDFYKMFNVCISLGVYSEISPEKSQGNSFENISRDILESFQGISPGVLCRRICAKYFQHFIFNIHRRSSPKFFRNYSKIVSKNLSNGSARVFMSMQFLLFIHGLILEFLRKILQNSLMIVLQEFFRVFHQWVHQNVVQWGLHGFDFSLSKIFSGFFSSWNFFNFFSRNSSCDLTCHLLYRYAPAT